MGGSGDAKSLNNSRFLLVFHDFHHLQKNLENGAKMDAERHGKASKNWPWAAQGRVFIDFGWFWKTMKFHDLLRSAWWGQQYENSEPDAKT